MTQNIFLVACMVVTHQAYVQSSVVKHTLRRFMNTASTAKFSAHMQNDTNTTPWWIYTMRRLNQPWDIYDTEHLIIHPCKRSNQTLINEPGVSKIFTRIDIGQKRETRIPGGLVRVSQLAFDDTKNTHANNNNAEIRDHIRKLILKEHSQLCFASSGIDPLVALWHQDGRCGTEALFDNISAPTNFWRFFVNPLRQRRATVIPNRHDLHKKYLVVGFTPRQLVQRILQTPSGKVYPLEKECESFIEACAEITRYDGTLVLK